MSIAFAVVQKCVTQFLAILNLRNDTPTKHVTRRNVCADFPPPPYSICNDAVVSTRSLIGPPVHHGQTVMLKCVTYFMDDPLLNVFYTPLPPKYSPVLFFGNLQLVVRLRPLEFLDSLGRSVGATALTFSF